MPRYLQLDAVSVGDIVQLKATVQVGGVWYKSMKTVSDDAVKADGVTVVPTLLRAIATELEEKYHEAKV